MLDILYKQRVSEPDRAFELLHEGVIVKTRFLDFSVGVVTEDELYRLVGRIDDERIPVESFEDDGVLNTKLVGRQFLRLPEQAVGGSAEEFNERHVFSVSDVYDVKEEAPFIFQERAIEVIKVADVSAERSAR